MKYFLIPLRIIAILLLFVIGLVLTFIFQHGAKPTQGITGKITCFWHKMALAIFGVSITVKGAPAKPPMLLVCNHVSWMDIEIIGSLLPVHFLSKIEVKSWPIMGWLASKAGTLYIDRGNHEATEKAAGVMSEALKEDYVVLFPEGTTTDGHIRRFHSKLFVSAQMANVDIQPVVIRYLTDKDALMNPAVVFIGDMTLVGSIFRSLACLRIPVEVTFLEPVKVDHTERHDLRKTLEDKIRQVIEPVMKPDASAQE